MSLDLKISKILRDAWSWERPSAMLTKTMAGLRSLTFAIVSSSSEPSISIASRMAQSGIWSLIYGWFGDKETKRGGRRLFRRRA